VQLDDNECIPGCYGYEQCSAVTLRIVTDDASWTMMENDIHNNDLDESTESKEIVLFGMCEGHCASDTDCMDDLLCMIRTNTNDAVPGCTGLRMGTQQRNFCYDPAASRMKRCVFIKRISILEPLL
jgi:hypothetical protein